MKEKIFNTKPPLKILVLHNMGPRNKWFDGVADVELMFPKYDKTSLYLVHNCFIKIPNYIRDYPFDAILLMSTFMDGVVMGLDSIWMQQFEFIRTSKAVKIAFPQDDYWFSETRDRFYVDYKIDKVFPVCPESSWPDLVPNYIKSGGCLEQGYTTYLTPHMLSHHQFMKDLKGRKYDVVYRAKKNPAAPNRYGYIKGILGEIFTKAVTNRNDLRLDISTDPKKMFYGKSWIEFIADSRAILGSNSGSSVNLRNREVYEQLLKFQHLNPYYSSDQVECSVFNENDRQKKYTAISPRNLEAAMVGVLQILIPGDYSGFMKPYHDYVPLKEDCSNVDEILEILKDESLCLNMIQNCYNSILSQNSLNVGNVLNGTLEFVRSKVKRSHGIEARFRKIIKRYKIEVVIREKIWHFLAVINKIFAPIFSVRFKNWVKRYLTI